MRRCFTLLICLIAFAASSCDDKTKEEIADVIVLSRSSVAFATEGGTTTISVASPSEWTATCPDGWVTLHPEGDYLTISVGSNATPDIRNAKITVKSDADQHEVDVRQAYALETVLLSTTAPKEISFDSEGEDYIFTLITNGEWTATPDTTPVSMNFWGFTPDYFAYSQEFFKTFLSDPKNMENLKSEFFIPLMVDKLISDKTATVEVLDTASKWFGVTYPEDRQEVVDKIQALVDAGEYPAKLF